MSLLVDIGNSRIKWARAQAEGLTEQGLAAYRPGQVSETLEPAWGAWPAPTHVRVANVAGPRVAAAVSEWVRARWALEPEFVQSPARGFGVHNAYSDPARLGVDRWAALVAARHRYGCGVCIVDCGTAVTVDALSASGEHQGGLILPGLAMMRRALTTNTRGIGRLAAGGRVALLARNTGDAVTAGTFYALVAAVDRIAGDVAAELGGRVVQVLTGGDAPALLPLLAGTWEHVPDLVLRGLAVMDGDQE